MFADSLTMDQSVIVVRREMVQDDRGNDVWSESETEVFGCSVQPLDSTEYLTSASDRVVSRWQFFGPPGMELKATDLIRVADDETYEVDGRPSIARGATRFLTHTSAVLKEYTG